MLENAQDYDYDIEEARDYDIVIFENTGFDSVNIPYRKTTIMNVADDHIVVENLGILQQRFLSYVDVPVIWEKVNAADYCIIYRHGSTYTSEYSFCYFVTNVSMLNTTTARLTLVPDFFTSVGDGGAYELQQSNPKLVIVDGIITRSTRALYDVSVDKKRLEDDPYTNPAFSMEVEEDWHPLEGTNPTRHVYIESSFQLVVTGQSDGACAYKDPTTGESVLVPNPAYAPEDGECKYHLEGSDKVMQSPGTNIFMRGANQQSDALLTLGLEKIRGMGAESAIIHQWIVSERYVIPETVQDGSRIKTLTGQSGYVTSSNTHIKQDDTGDEIAEAINYCSLCKFGIMSASGSSMEASPKDISLNDNNKLVVDYKADPRPDGKPYFRIRGLYHMNPEDNDAGFFRNAIEGLPWKQVPLVYQQVSGNALNTIKYNAERKVKDVGYEASLSNMQADEWTTRNYLNAQKAANTLTGMTQTGVLSAVQGMQAFNDAGGGLTGLVAGGASAALTGITTGISYDMTNNLLEHQLNNLDITSQTQQQGYTNTYIADKIKDAINYGIQQNVAVPEIMFPYNTETIRDFYGNGVLIYHYKYNSKDITRIRKILQAYGIKYTEFANASFFNPGNKEFAYLEGAMTIGKRPRWWAEGIEAQLAKGVRIWTVKPHHIGA